MKNYLKNILYKIGLYKLARQFIIKFYYPYKNYKMRIYANELLSKLHEVFEENTKDYWLDFGTLLGYVREKKIIKGDLDLDFGILISDEMKSLKEVLELNNIHIVQRLVVEGKVVYEQYEYKGIGFDIFYYRKNYDKIITNIWLPNDYSIPQKESYLQKKGKLYEIVFNNFSTQKIKFYNIPFKIPKDFHNYLSEHFGEDYMIPNPKFTHDDEKNKYEVNKDFEVIFYEKR